MCTLRRMGAFHLLLSQHPSYLLDWDSHSPWWHTCDPRCVNDLSQWVPRSYRDNLCYMLDRLVRSNKLYTIYFLVVGRSDTSRTCMCPITFRLVRSEEGYWPNCWWSLRQDSNLRFLRPKRSDLTGLAYWEFKTWMRSPESNTVLELMRLLCHLYTTPQ